MNKSKGVWAASITGFIAVLGAIAVCRFLHAKEYDAYYNDYHRHFDADSTAEEDHHGVELLAMN